MGTIQFLNLAQNELDDVFEAYEYKQKNLGSSFIEEVSHTLNLVNDYPHTWSKSSQHTQRCLIKGFPYALMYQNMDDAILVVAIKNIHKKPIHWVSKSTTLNRISHLPETIYIR